MAHDELEGVDPQPRPLGSFTGERHCLECRGVEFFVGLQELQCINCGAKQYADGTPVMPDPLFLVPSEANKGARGVASPDQLYSWEELFAQERGGAPGSELPAAAEIPGLPPATPPELLGDGSD